MKFVIAVLLLFAVLPGVARSQTTCIDRDPEAVATGSYGSTIPLTSPCRPTLATGAAVTKSDANRASTLSSTSTTDGGGDNPQPAYATKTKTTGQVIFEGFYYSVRGQTGIAIPPGSIDYIGDPELINNMPTADLFDLISLGAVKDGIANGTIRCSDGATMVRVSQAACVMRYGSGSGTYFVPCNGDCCVKTYSVSCANGTPIIELMGSESNGCTGGACESTCR